VQAETRDVLVAGGGMVGLSSRARAGQGGLSIAVVDPIPASAVLAVAFDGRVSALSYSAVRMFRALEVWPHLESCAQPILDILVTDSALGGSRVLFPTFRSS